MTNTQLYNDIETRRIRMQKTVEGWVRAALNQERDKVVLALQTGMLNPEQLLRENTIHNLFTQLYEKVGVYFAKITYKRLSKQLRKDAVTDYFTRYMNQYVLQNTAKRVANITNTTRKFVRRIIQTGLDKGYGTDKIASMLRKNWNKISRYRATMIARTEVIGASSVGALLGAQTVAKDLDLKMNKVWLARLDNRTRDSHKRINGTRVPLDEYFIVNGYKMQHPADMNGPASECVNCRCAITFQVVD